MNQRTRSFLLVAAQLACLVFLAWTGRWVAQRPLWLAAEIAGILLAACSVLAIGIRRVRVTPDAPADAKLIQKGPYRWVRHPMYAAVLLLTLALVGDDFSPARVAVWAGLLVVLLLKLRHEETLLAARFPEYAAYRQRTKRLIPGLY